MSDFTKVYIFIEMKDPHDPFTHSICGDYAMVDLGHDRVGIDYYNTVDDMFGAPFRFDNLEDEKALLNLLLLRDAKRRVKHG